MNAAEGWARIFGVDPERESAELLLRGAALLHDAAATREFITRLDDNGRSWLRHFGEVEETVANFGYLSEDMAFFLSPLRDTGLHALEMCEGLQRRTSREPTLPADTVAELLRQVQDLIADVRAAADLDDETRQRALHHLLEIARALTLAPQQGGEPLRRAVDETVGDAARDPRWLERLRGSKAFNGFAAVLLATDFALNLALAGKELLAGEEEPKPSTVVVQLVEGGDPVVLPIAPPK
ncbi:hypothetical protein [Spirilliplanes yamanashiensis]|uniref:hypothetical protein n=1 Tax=Spirilliplanes yamanashiensis TaxID=42233 RepID=UPI00194FCCEF|nr:hypothetical protein [Spirilliplanes yamanashiensis]MDP9816925.1 hypothetical protein [Spirilliplanes yamanashiensis]